MGAPVQSGMLYHFSSWELFCNVCCFYVFFNFPYCPLTIALAGADAMQCNANDAALKSLTEMNAIWLRFGDWWWTDLLDRDDCALVAIFEMDIVGVLNSAIEMNAIVCELGILEERFLKLCQTLTLASTEMLELYEAGTPGMQFWICALLYCAEAGVSCCWGVNREKS